MCTNGPRTGKRPSIWPCGEGDSILVLCRQRMQGFFYRGIVLWGVFAVSRTRKDVVSRERQHSCTVSKEDRSLFFYRGIVLWGVPAVSRTRKDVLSRERRHSCAVSQEDRRLSFYRGSVFWDTHTHAHTHSRTHSV